MPHVERQYHIKCNRCGELSTVMERTKIFADKYFRSKGWRIGTATGYCFCAACVNALRDERRYKPREKKDV